MKALVLAAGLAALLATGCGPDCSYTSASGACYVLGSADWTVDAIEAAEAQAVELYAGLVKADPVRLVRVLEDAIVSVEPDKFLCGDTWAAGCQDGLLLRVLDLGCPRRSPIAHESAHLFDAALGRPTDYHYGSTLYGLREPYRTIGAETMALACPGVGP